MRFVNCLLDFPEEGAHARGVLNWKWSRYSVNWWRCLTINIPFIGMILSVRIMIRLSGRFWKITEVGAIVWRYEFENIIWCYKFPSRVYNEDRLNG